jgi:Uma2 family endonuclease
MLFMQAGRLREIDAVRLTWRRGVQMTALPDDWLHPPPGGWTLADVKSLPEGCRVEVIDGALIVNPSPLPIHQRIARRLANALELSVPTECQVETDVDVMLAEGPLDYLTPDVVVFDKTIPLTTRPIPGQAVSLVIEVVSKGSRREDRGSKPLAYAEAGIPHFWRVETPESGALALAIHAFELDAGRYVQVGEHVGRARVTRPFPVELVVDRLAE